MTILDFILLVIIAAVCGSIGQAIAGYSLGGCLVSAVVGFIGALLGMWVARLLGLPVFFSISLGSQDFPIIWSIIGSALFAIIIGLLTRRRGRLI
ncbi:MAG: hypothetical protein H6631_11690 [Anaerolineaceae bacterium]|nr:hypothetical protein [Anaerolineaceae bacterium]MCB9101365.1 hypothetical protein [Anaerolineales bacterium]